MVLATEIGAPALYLFVLWLASAFAASWVSERKGYGTRPGLAAGLLLSLVGALIWLLIPAREGSLWKREGMLPRAASLRRSGGRDRGGGGDDASRPSR
ncbi:MAG: hypothetical protein JSS68_11510 [Actinobacteria bacterium]|nr:hypothetical protein [Actinomycetota bacterium]